MGLTRTQVRILEVLEDQGGVEGRPGQVLRLLAARLPGGADLQSLRRNVRRLERARLVTCESVSGRLTAVRRHEPD